MTGYVDVIILVIFLGLLGRLVAFLVDFLLSEELGCECSLGPDQPMLIIALLAARRAYGCLKVNSERDIVVVVKHVEAWLQGGRFCLVLLTGDGWLFQIHFRRRPLCSVCLLLLD